MGKKLYSKKDHFPSLKRSMKLSGGTFITALTQGGAEAKSSGARRAATGGKTTGGSSGEAKAAS